MRGLGSVIRDERSLPVPCSFLAFFSSIDSLGRLWVLLSWVVSPRLSVLAGSDWLDSQHPCVQLVIETFSPFVPDIKPAKI